jgi:hypothetical protein
MDSQLRAGVLAKIQFGQIAVKVFFVHVLVASDQPALEDRKEAFQSIGMYIAARPLMFAVVNAFMIYDLTPVRVRTIGHEAAVLMQMFDQRVANVPIIQVRRTDVSAALNTAKYLRSRFGVQRHVLARDRRFKIQPGMEPKRESPGPRQY